MLTQKPDHTPLPWTEWPIAGDCSMKHPGDFEFVLKSCNSHYDLLAACKFAITCLQDPEMEDVAKLEEMLEAAILKAEGNS